jgi:hypothetical protein
MLSGSLDNKLNGIVLVYWRRPAMALPGGLISYDPGTVQPSSTVISNVIQAYKSNWCG